MLLLKGPTVKQSAPFKMVIFVKINLTIQVSSSGRKNAARIPHAV